MRSRSLRRFSKLPRLAHQATGNREADLLRRWREDDRGPFALLNADPLVMEQLPAVLCRDQSDRLVERIESGFQEHGFGLWALELRGDGISSGSPDSQRP